MIVGKSFLTPSMTSSVEAEPALRIVISTAFLPSTRTMLSCGGLPRCTKATSLDVDDGAVDALDRQLVELLDLGRRVVQIDDIFEAADLLGPDRRDLVLAGERGDHVGCRDVIGLQLGRVQVDVDLQNLAAVGRRHRRAGDRRQLRPDEVLPVVGELGLRQAGGRQRELDDRHRRGVEQQHVGRGDALRQQLQHRLRGGGDLGDRRVLVDARLEVDLHDAVARQRLRLDVLDVVDLRGERALVVIDDAPRHRLRRQAVVGEHRGDDGNADVGKDVGRRLDPGDHAEDGDQHRHDDERVGRCGRRQRDADDGEVPWSATATAVAVYSFPAARDPSRVPTTCCKVEATSSLRHAPLFDR